jgi:hypothetical protein
LIRTRFEAVIRLSLNRPDYQYYAVPENTGARRAFRHQVVRHWMATLRRRSQRTTVTWERITRLEARWLPTPLICIPGLSSDSDATTQGNSPVR